MKIRSKALAITVTGLAVSFFSGVAAAACVEPIFPPLAYERPSWNNLESLQVDPPNVAGIVRRQDLRSDGHGRLNIDFYSITLDSQGQTAAQLFAKVRSDLNSLVFTGTTYRVEPFDDAQAALWSSGNPRGAVMVFTLAEIPGVMPLERGAVFVSCSSETALVFSTIEMAPYGVHPVAGNRAFGVHEHGDGSLSIYVMATDRVVDGGIFAVMGDTLHEAVFSEGDKVWQRMLDNVANAHKARNPRSRFVFSKRVTL